MLGTLRDAIHHRTKDEIGIEMLLSNAVRGDWFHPEILRKSERIH